MENKHPSMQDSTRRRLRHWSWVAHRKVQVKDKKDNKNLIIARYDMTSIPKEYNIDIQNKFEKLLEIQEEYTAD